jgi:hypothetical protein
MLYRFVEECNQYARMFHKIRGIVRSGLHRVALCGVGQPAHRLHLFRRQAAGAADRQLSG